MVKVRLINESSHSIAVSKWMHPSVPLESLFSVRSGESRLVKVSDVCTDRSFRLVSDHPNVAPVEIPEASCRHFKTIIIHHEAGPNVIRLETIEIKERTSKVKVKNLTNVVLYVHREQGELKWEPYFEIPQRGSKIIRVIQKDTGFGFCSLPGHVPPGRGTPSYVTAEYCRTILKTIYVEPDSRGGPNLVLEPAHMSWLLHPKHNVKLANGQTSGSGASASGQGVTTSTTQGAP